MSMASFAAFACDACKSLSVRHPDRCRSCGATAIVPVHLTGRGTLTSFTTIRVPPTAFLGQEPYSIAVIDLEEGLRVTARLLVPNGSEAAIGGPAVFEAMLAYGPVFRLMAAQVRKATC